MRSQSVGLAAAIILISGLSSAQVIAASLFDELALAQASMPRDSLRSMMFTLSLKYGTCALRFQNAELQSDRKAAAQSLSEARNCQAEAKQVGDAQISKLSEELPKPAAQVALKELAFYWRTRISELQSSNGDVAALAVIRDLKDHAERIRLANDW